MEGDNDGVGIGLDNGRKLSLCTTTMEVQPNVRSRSTLFHFPFSYLASSPTLSTSLSLSLFLPLSFSSSLRVNISPFVGEYAWTAAAGNPDRPWKARSANIDWFLVNSIAALLPAMALPTWKAIERRTTLLGGKAVPGISCTPVDVQSPFPMSIPTVKSSRRRAPCHDYPHLATAHRPSPPIIPADRRIIYEARCDTESGIRRSRSTFTQNRGNVRSFVLSRLERPALE